MESIEYLKKQTEIIINLFNSKNYDEVIRKSKILIKNYSNQIIFYNSLSLALMEKGKNEEAIKYLNQALKYDSNSIFVLNNLGLAYTNLNILDKAKFYFDEALQKKPDFFDALINYGNLYLVMNQNEQASAMLEKTIKIAKNNFQKESALLALGTSYQQSGNFERAEKIYKELLKINPKNTKADIAISIIHKYINSEDSHLKDMEKKILEVNNDYDLKSLYFALGKAYEDINNINKSFQFVEMGNKIEKKKINYKIEEEEKTFIKIKKFFSNNKLKKISPPEKKMIFIVGMPRSGTTLAEQIISSHSEVFGAGELSYLSEFFNEKILNENFLINDNDESYQNLLIDCQQYYLKKINTLDIKEEFIIDKAPLNFKWIGFINNIFPNSKIINCERDPMAVCWSNFKNSFSSRSIGFSYDLNDLGKYYNLYDNLNDFWNKLYPNIIYNLNYQKLVDDKDSEIKKIIKFCNLSWEENCLFPEKNKRSVSTRSLSQVRSPIYKSSVRSWEKFSEKLDVLKRILQKN